MERWLIHLFQGSPPPTPFRCYQLGPKKKQKTKQQKKFLSTIAHFSGVDYGLLSNK